MALTCRVEEPSTASIAERRRIYSLWFVGTCLSLPDQKRANPDNGTNQKRHHKNDHGQFLQNGFAISAFTSPNKLSS